MRKVLILLLLSFVCFRCDNDSTDDCSVLATTRYLNELDGCDWVFELQNGTRLQPLRVIDCGTPPFPKEIMEDPLFDFVFEDGKTVLISYQETPMASICMVGPVVKITCITEVTYVRLGE